MKKQTLLIITSLVFQISAISQPCLPDGISFYTQSQIDSFQIIYPNCTEIGGDVEIYGNSIVNLNGLSDLQSILGDLIIRGNDNLVTLSGFNNLTNIGGDLYIGYYVNLPIIGNPSLTSIYALENVSSIGGNIQIAGNDALQSLNGLHNMSTINGGLEIGHNASLTNFDDLINLTSVGKYLRIFNNQSLSSLSGLDNITSIVGDLSISNNPISDLSGIDNIAYIGGSLLILYNENLDNLNELQNLISIGENLSIYGNSSIKTLSGLFNTSSIGGHLWIVDNDSLTSLLGLDNINSNSINQVKIVHNSSLFTCDAQSICDYITSSNAIVEINNNAPGCNNIEEVQAACDTVSVQEMILEDYFTISPNPCLHNVNLSFTVFEEGYVIAELFEISGNKVKDLLNEPKKPGTYKMEFNVSDLQAGIYFVTIELNGRMQTKKIIKL